MKEAGNNVTLLARGKRFEDLKEEGIVLEEFETGERTVTRVKLVDKMPADEYFDLCVVLIQKTQLAEALPVLATNSRIPAFLFMHNTAEGSQPIIDALGENRIILGHANAGGERDGNLVRYMIAEKMTIGELKGRITERLKEIAGAFQEAGFPVVLSKNMEAWKYYHVALVGPLANAIYMAGECNYRLSRSKEGVRKGIRGMREAFKVLKANGIPVEPKKFHLMNIIPEFILVPLFQRVLNTRLMDIGGARHARNARDEMARLNQELFRLAEKARIKTPVMRELHRYSDPDVEPAITD